MDKGKVAVVVSCYNHERFLKDCVDSILAQTYENYHIFFWDNGSTDNSKERVLDYGHQDKAVNKKLSLHTFDHLLWKNKQPLPIGIARYLMVQNAFKEEFDYIAIVDADDIWLPNKLERQVEAFKTFKNIKLCFSDCYYLYWEDEVEQVENYPAWVLNKKEKDLPKTFHDKYPPLMEGNVFKNLLFKYNFMPCPTLMFEKEALKLSIGAPMAYTSAEDYDWILKLIWNYNNAVGYVKEPLAKYRIHRDQLTKKTPVRCTMEEIDVVKRFSQHLPSKIDRIKFRKRMAILYAKLLYKELLG